MIPPPFPGDWVDHARCKGVNPNLFMTSDPDAVEHAVNRYCVHCPVRSNCLDYAVNQGRDLHGIWGGKTLTERLIIRRARNLHGAVA